MSQFFILFLYLFFPKQRRDDWGGVLTCLLYNYLCPSGFPVVVVVVAVVVVVVADLPNLPNLPRLA